MADWKKLYKELADDLQEARDAVADWAAYAPEYFQQKHNLQGELNRINNQLDRAHKILAQHEQKVDRDVTEHLEWLSVISEQFRLANLPAEAEKTDRVADLLQRQASLAQEVWDLIGESYGVAGLHLNGDLAPWDELLPGGRFERLLSLLPASNEEAEE